MSEAIATSPLFKLVTKPMPHQFGAGRMVAREETPSRHEQREWTCLKCGLVRITVLPAGRREWRFGNGCQFIDQAGAPECAAAEGTA